MIFSTVVSTGAFFCQRWIALIVINASSWRPVG